MYTSKYAEHKAKDPACTYQPTGQPLEIATFTWTDEARARLERIPIAFIREKTRKGVEAQRQAVHRITPEVMNGALSGMERPKAFGKMPSFVKDLPERETTPERLV